MRVLMLADMEGVCGIQSWEHTGGDSPFYQEGRRLYTDEISAAVRGAKKAGATRIVCADGHGGSVPGGKPFMSWLPDRLEPGAEYVMGYKWARYIEPMEAGECDAVLLVGAHARAGTVDGVLCHTVSSETWYDAFINDTGVGESGILAAVAGSFGVPTIFVSGDAATCREVEELIGPGVFTAPVKVGLGRYAVRNLAPVDACALIERRVADAIQNRDTWPKPLTFDPPVTFRVELASPDRADIFRGRTGVEVIESRTVQASGATFWEAWDRFWYRT